MLSQEELQRIKSGFDIIGNDATLNYAVELAYRAAFTDLTVLVTGESGVGKESIPKIVHQYSARKHAKYFAVNCGGIPEGTIDSELFGHEKGAFTGASEKRKGYFEEADGGTLFLDEVAELPLPSQAKLLRVLQSGEFIRVGSSQVLKCDVRVIAATNVHLEEAVSRGKFRADLYYRLNAIPIYVPALRERPGDIELLFRKFLADFSEKYRTSRLRLSAQAKKLLTDYRWPPNIRQLKNVAEQLSAFESVSDPRQSVDISGETMARYIPKEQGITLPVKSGDDDAGGLSSADKEMIFRILYQLKADVDRLKAIVLQGEGAENPAPKVLPAPHNDSPIITPHAEYYAEKDENAHPGTINVDDYDMGEEHTIVDRPLSIQEVSEELIKAALKRNGGKRSAAAAELGISERTLYRKIKEYNIKM